MIYVIYAIHVPYILINSVSPFCQAKHNRTQMLSATDRFLMFGPLV
jgi:hypothetical protein